MNIDRWKRAVRDVIAEAMGVGIVAHQAFIIPPGKASEFMFLAGIGLMGVPVYGLSRQPTGTTDGTGSPSPSPQAASSSLGSSTPSPPSGAGGDPR